MQVIQAKQNGSYQNNSVENIDPVSYICLHTRKTKKRSLEQFLITQLFNDNSCQAEITAIAINIISLKIIS